MKKNISIILIIIVGCFLLTLFFLNGKTIYKTLEDRANLMLEDMRKRKKINQYKSKGYVVLKDESIWYSLDENEDTVTLISAYPLDSDGKINEKNPILKTYNESCLEDCNIIEKESDFSSFIAKKFLEPLINKLGVENSKNIVIRQITIDDLKKLGCDIEHLTCDEAPSWLSEYPFWTSTVISGTNNVFIVDKDKTIKEYPANEKAYVRVVLITSKENIY